MAETPARVAPVYKNYFCGYEQNPEEFLLKTFAETAGYHEMILLRRIPFHTHCEHHIAPIIGQAWLGYVPRRRVVWISRLARVVEAYASRLQIQERLTAEIADTFEKVLKPEGVGWSGYQGAHHCITSRGVQKHGVDLTTSRMLGCFRDNPVIGRDFWQ